MWLLERFRFYPCAKSTNIPRPEKREWLLSLKEERHSSCYQLDHGRAFSTATVLIPLVATLPHL